MRMVLKGGARSWIQSCSRRHDRSPNQQLYRVLQYVALLVNAHHPTPAGYNPNMSLTPQKLPLPFGGVCDRGEMDDIRPDEALWLRDVQPALSAAAMQQRPGFIQQPLNFTLGSIVSMKGWRVIGANLGLLAFSDGTIRPMDTTYAVGASIYSSGATGGQDVPCFEPYRDVSNNARMYFIANSTTTPQVWDGAAASSSAWANAPLNCRVLKVWRNRMCVSGHTGAFPHRVWYSNVGDPDAPASQYGNNWVDLMDARTSAFDYIVGMEVAGDYLVVFKRMSTWVIYDPVSFNNRRISDVGAVDWPSITRALGRAWWISAPDRLYSTDGVKIREECPQATFVAGEWARGTNSNVGRTWMAATEDEIYVSQTNQDAQRELLYIPLREKNQRGEFPVFRHMHRRTLSSETAQWNPTSSSAVKEQYMAVVAAFPRVNSYATNIVGPRVREFVFGGYSGVGLAAGRFYTMGAFLDGDTIALSADTAETTNNAKVLAQWMVRLPFREMESFERIRRLNFTYRYGLRVSTARELTTKYVGTGFSSTGKPSFAADFTGDKWMVGVVSSSSGRTDFARFRPESRGRSTIVHIQRPLGVSADNDAIFVYEMEAVFRGGKEH
jgi:hypothetical protein